MTENALQQYLVILVGYHQFLCNIQLVGILEGDKMNVICS